MNAEEIQRIIEKTNYWDEVILDIQVKYLGTEVDIFYGNDKDAWRLSFKGCRLLHSESYVPSEDIENMKEKKPSKFDYYGHEILIENAATKDFFLAKINFQFLEMKIEFRSISVEKVESDDWFWKNNT